MSNAAEWQEFVDSATLPPAERVERFRVLVHLAFNVAANLYLILSVAALYPDEWLLRRLWSARFLIDVAVTMSALAVLR